MSKNIVVFISGEGTNLQALIDAIDDFKLSANISAVVCNNPKANGILRAQRAGIPVEVSVYSNECWPNRTSYDYQLANRVRINYQPKLVVLAGWMHVFTENFMKVVGCPVINLHPALPGQFPGKQAIEDAWKAYQNGDITETGIMVHHVVPEIDAGETIVSEVVPIQSTDTLETLRERIQRKEKPLLIRAVEKTLANIRRIASGKVCDIYSVGETKLAFHYTDRASCFDRHVCNVPGKGLELAKQSSFWFRELEDKLGIPTHFIERRGATVIAKKCEPIKIEVIVRGYLTGSLARKRAWPGIPSSFFGDLKQNEKLPVPIVTPTTKSDDHDEPIGTKEILKLGLLSANDWEKVRSMALKIYTYGAKFLAKHGLILADTKYEFGKDCLSDNIILMDECHSSDGSRIWLESDYEQALKEGRSPASLDKDYLRRYASSDSQTIDESTLKTLLINYQLYTSCLTNNNRNMSDDYITSELLNHENRNMVVIVAGSTSDQWHVEKIQKELSKQRLSYKVFYRSAHKNTRDVLKILETVPARLYITCAGRSNALSGVIAAQSTKPVIACPVFKDKTDMLVNIQSSLQCPSLTPVMTVLDPSNVALCAKRIVYG